MGINPPSPIFEWIPMCFFLSKTYREVAQLVAINLYSWDDWSKATFSTRLSEKAILHGSSNQPTGDLTNYHVI